MDKCSVKGVFPMNKHTENYLSTMQFPLSFLFLFYNLQTVTFIQCQGSYQPFFQTQVKLLSNVQVNWQYPTIPAPNYRYSWRRHLAPKEWDISLRRVNINLHLSKGQTHNS